MPGPVGSSGTASTTPATVTLNAAAFAMRNKGAVAILISWDGGTGSYPTSIDPGQGFSWDKGPIGAITVKTASSTAAYEIVRVS